MSEPRSTGGGWDPIVYFWDGGWIGVGPARPGGTVPQHAHHAVQISLWLTGPVAVGAPDAQWSVGDGILVLPDVAHTFDPRGEEVAMIFIDPECREGRWLRHSFAAPLVTIDGARFSPFRPALRAFSERRPSAAEAARLITDVVHSLCEGPPPLRPIDERVARALEWIRGREVRGLSLESVAREVFLSPSRFAHLFTDEVGLPFRRYLLWRKLNRAMEEFGRGSTLSAAAHAAGFSDSAHLTRTFYQMFGIPPTVMLGAARFYEIPAPFEVSPRAPGER